MILTLTIRKSQRERERERKGAKRKRKRRKRKRDRNSEKERGKEISRQTVAQSKSHYVNIEEITFYPDDINFERHLSTFTTGSIKSMHDEILMHSPLHHPWGRLYVLSLKEILRPPRAANVLGTPRFRFCA